LCCVEIAGGGAAERKAAIRDMGDTYITHAEVVAVVRREVDRVLGDEKVLQVWADHLDTQVG